MGNRARTQRQPNGRGEVASQSRTTIALLRGLDRPYLLFVVLTASIPLLFDGTRYLPILTLAAIFGTVAVSLDLLIGYAGLLSLGQAALFGTSAYTAAVLSTTHGWRPELAFVAGILAAVVITLVVSPILRLEGFYFALATLAIVLIFEAVTRNWIDVTGGSSGFVGVDHFQLGPLQLRSPVDYFWFAWVVLVIAMLLALRVAASRFGRGLLAIREDEQAADSLGIAVGRVKVQVWLVAGLLAGLAGGVYTFYLRFLSPPQFGLVPSIILVIAVVIGGTGSVYGPVIGVAFLRLLPAVFEGFEERSILVYGLAIIVVTILAPGGIVGVARAGLRRFTRSWPPGAGPSATAGGGASATAKVAGGTDSGAESVVAS